MGILNGLTNENLRFCKEKLDKVREEVGDNPQFEVIEKNIKDRQAVVREKYVFFVGSWLLHCVLLAMVINRSNPSEGMDVFVGITAFFNMAFGMVSIKDFVKGNFPKFYASWNARDEDYEKGEIERELHRDDYYTPDSHEILKKIENIETEIKAQEESNVRTR